MAIISICPRCQASIQLSEEHANPHERFRCPKCRDIFLLHEALDILAESPPEALPVAAEGAPKAATGAKPDAKPAGSGAGAPSLPPIGVAPVSGPAAQEIHAEDLDDTDEYEDEEPVSDNRPVRRPQREPGMSGTLIGVILGGVGGIYAGAWALNQMGIPLPSVVKGLPGMGPPAAQQAADAPKADEKIALAPPEKKVANPEPPPVEPVAKKSAPEPKEAPPEPPPKKEAPPPEPPPVKGAATYSPDQLGAALGDAHKASGGGVGKSVGTTTVEPALYEKLCELAERVTFVVAPSGDKTLEGRRRGVTDVMKRVAGTQDNVVKLGTLATQKVIAGPATPPGIVLAGEVRLVDQRGKLWAVDLALYGGGKRVTVMCPVLANMKPGDKVVILGVLVDDPAANLTGFSGIEKRVVWGGLPVSIPPSTFR